MRYIINKKYLDFNLLGKLMKIISINIIIVMLRSLYFFFDQGATH